MNQTSLIGRVFALIASVALIVMGLMFSVVLIAFIVGAALIAWGYLWWKTRALRKQMRERMAAEQRYSEVFKGEVFEGEIIEGEVIRKVVSLEEDKR